MNCLHEDSPEGVRVIRLIGRMDIQGAEQISLKFTALCAGTAPILVNLSELDFIGSLGIGTLVAAARSVHQRKGQFVLFGAKADVMTALNRTNVPTIIPTRATWAEARALIAAPAGS